MNIKDQIKPVNTAMIEEMKKVAEKYGFTVEQKGNVSYDATGWNLKIRVEEKVSDDVKEKTLKDEFVKMAKFYGFDPSGFGKVIIDGNKKIKVIGYRPNRPKNPFQLQNVENPSETYKAPLGWYLQHV